MSCDVVGKLQVWYYIPWMVVWRPSWYRKWMYYWAWLFYFVWLRSGRSWHVPTGTVSAPRVILAQSCIVPPRSEALLPGKLDGEYDTNGAWGSVSPTTKRVLPNDLLVDRTVDLRRPGFPVRVANISDFSRTIPEGTELTTISVVGYSDPNKGIDQSVPA